MLNDLVNVLHVCIGHGVVHQVPGSSPTHAVFLNVLYDPDATGIASTGFFRLVYLD